MALLLGISNLSAGLPPNDLHLEDNLFSDRANMTEQEFRQITDRIVDFYKPIVRGFGAELEATHKWEDPTVNAFANQSGNTWMITMFGGLARRPEVTDDGFALVVCHEIGHHIAGFPFYPSNSWASSEGQSDYWASQACARNVWKNDLEINAGFRATADPLVISHCDQVWTTTAEQNLCYRIAMAGYSLANLLGTISGRQVSFLASDATQVSSTMTSHPPAQCRLDTYTAGALCERDFRSNLIPGRGMLNGLESENIASQVSCTSADFFGRSARPRCWFKPERPNMIATTDMRWTEVFGNGNAVVEPGEAFEISPVLINRSQEDFSNLRSELKSRVKGIVPIRGQGSFNELFALSRARQDEPFLVYLDPNLECGSDLNLEMLMKIGRRQGLENISKMLGASQMLGRFEQTAALRVPDNDANGVISFHWVSIAGGAKYLNLKISLDHAYLSDLRLKMVGSNGRAYPLTLPRNSGRTHQLEFKIKLDQADVSGLWALHLADVVARDEGQLISWSIEFERINCSPAPESMGLPDLWTELGF